MAARAPRPPSPGAASVASNMSRVSTLSKPTVSTTRKVRDPSPGLLGGSPGKAPLNASALASIPTGPSAIDSFTVEACLEFVSAPHYTWDSASKEMSRMALKAALSQSALERNNNGFNDTASAVSTVSAYSIAKSTTSTRRGPAKGHMTMLPLGGQNGSTIAPAREVPNMIVSGQSAGGFSFITQQRGASSHSTAASAFDERGRVQPNDDGLLRSGSFAGSAGGLSGIRSARAGGNVSSAPVPGRRPIQPPAKGLSKAPQTNTSQKKQPAKAPDFGDLLKVGPASKH